MSSCTTANLGYKTTKTTVDSCKVDDDIWCIVHVVGMTGVLHLINMAFVHLFQCTDLAAAASQAVEQQTIIVCNGTSK